MMLFRKSTAFDNAVQLAVVTLNEKLALVSLKNLSKFCALT